MFLPAVQQESQSQPDLFHSEIKLNVNEKVAAIVIQNRKKKAVTATSLQHVGKTKD